MQFNRQCLTDCQLVSVYAELVRPRMIEEKMVLRLAKVSGRIINLCFAVSIIYNLVGLYYASQGLLRPMYAAILMPCSTLSIVIISTGATSLVAKKLGLSLKVAG